MTTYTIMLAKKDVQMPMARDDEHHAQLSADPTIAAFPQISSSNFAPINLTESGDNAAQNAEVLIANTNGDWVNKRWRPIMAWQYMAVCITDFIIFPVLWSILQAAYSGSVTNQWQPITLMGAGLYHLAMGAVLGIAAYGRSKEKIAGTA